MPVLIEKSENMEHTEMQKPARSKGVRDYEYHALTSCGLLHYTFYSFRMFSYFRVFRILVFNTLTSSTLL